MTEGLEAVRKKRIMVVGGSAEAIEVVGEILEGNGYEVRWAGDSHEAVMLYEVAMQRQAPFDVVVMDLSGRNDDPARAAMADLLGVDPAVRAIALGNEQDRSDCWRYGFKAALVKPCRSTELLGEIRRVLELSPA